MTWLKKHYLVHLARPLALRIYHGPWLLHLVNTWLSLLCLVSLLAPIGWFSGPLADLHAGTLLIVVLGGYFLGFDRLATGMVLGFIGVMRWLLGPSYAAAYLPASLLLVVLVFLNLPLLWKTLRQPFANQPWLVRIGQVLFDMVAGSIHTALFSLYRHGYQPETWNQLQAEARRQRTRRERLRWRNWGHTAECSPQIAFLPENLHDLRSIVAEARASQRRIRVAATGHSWPALATTDDILVITHRLDQVTADLSNPAMPMIIAEAGATNYQINHVLQQHGLTLPFNVVLESVRIGGLVSTGSHGSGWDTPTLSDLIEAIEMVNAAGDLVCYRVSSHGPEVMDAVRLSLGLFGIIYRLHLRVEPNYRVRQSDIRLPVAQLCQQIGQLVPKHEALDIYYWPYQQEVTLRIWDRTTEAATVPASRNTWGRKLNHTIFALFHSLEHAIMQRWPTTTPAIASFNYQWFPHHQRVTDVMEAIHWRDAIELLRVSCIEFAFELDPEFRTFQQAWDDAIEVIEAYAAQGRYPFNMTLNARFISHSSCLLAPAARTGHTCYIEILSSTPTPHWQEFASAIALRWMQLPGSRPHWAKEWEFIPGIEAFLGQAYRDEIQQFVQIHTDLGVDPQHMFSNDLLDRVIFAHAQPNALAVVAEENPVSVA